MDLLLLLVHSYALKNHSRWIYFSWKCTHMPYRIKLGGLLLLKVYSYALQNQGGWIASAESVLICLTESRWVDCFCWKCTHMPYRIKVGGLLLLKVYSYALQNQGGWIASAESVLICLTESRWVDCFCWKCTHMPYRIKVGGLLLLKVYSYALKNHWFCTRSACIRILTPPVYKRR